jgi:hypothetical protein
MPNDALAGAIQHALSERFGEQIAVDAELPGLSELVKFAS